MKTFIDALVFGLFCIALSGILLADLLGIGW